MDSWPGTVVEAPTVRSIDALEKASPAIESTIALSIQIERTGEIHDGTRFDLAHQTSTYPSRRTKKRVTNEDVCSHSPQLSAEPTSGKGNVSTSVTGGVPRRNATNDILLGVRLKIREDCHDTRGPAWFAHGLICR